MKKRFLAGGAVVLLIALLRPHGSEPSAPGAEPAAARDARIGTLSPRALVSAPAQSSPPPAVAIPAGAEERVARTTELLRDARQHGHAEEAARLEEVLRQVDDHGPAVEEESP